MKYFTTIIPLPLAEKLKDKGMPIILGKRYANICPNSEDDEMPYQVLCSTTYAEIFDWLMSEKRLHITIKPYFNTDSWESYITKIPETDMPKAGREIYVRHTWHEAVNKAIEKALTLF